MNRFNFQKGNNNYPYILEGDPMTAKKKNPAAIWFSTMLIKMLKKKPKKKKFKSQFGKEAFFDGENNKDEDKPPPYKK